MKRPPTIPEPLHQLDTMVAWLADVTGQAEDTVRSRLRREFEQPGITVAEAFSKTGLVPYTWHDDLARFYETTDAFLYELVIWNRNKLKRRMRRWTARHLMEHQHLTGEIESLRSAEPGDWNRRVLDILCIGDGLGFDSVYLAQFGHRVTYFEVPGYSSRFADKVFTHCKVDVRVLTDPDQIPTDAFDAVVCLDVLEHVPDPPALVETIVAHLRPSGRLVVHAPFYMIHPSTPTHLKSARRHSGSLALYTRAGLRLIDGEPFWNPLALRKCANVTRPPPLPASASTLASASASKRLVLKLVGCYMALGRMSALPFCWVNTYRQHKGSWFER